MSEAEPIAPPGTVANDKPKAKLTAYHVLELQGANTYKLVAADVQAAGRNDAVRRSVELTEQKREFVAVPSRSMKPIPGYLEVAKPRAVIG